MPIGYNRKMPKTIKTESIVLRKRNLPNKDIIITLFTAELGKINVFGKGIKKITSRRLPNTQTGNLVDTILYKKDDRFYLQETRLISGFTNIKDKTDKINYLYLVLFVVERLAPEGQYEKTLYTEIKRFLVDLSRAEVPDVSLLAKYLNRILMILGYNHEPLPLSDVYSTIEGIIDEKLPAFDI